MIEVLNMKLPDSILDQIDEGAVDQVLANIAESARKKWIDLAGELATTRRDYVNGIQAVDMAPGVATISLLGVLPNIVENGMPATDLRDTLLGPNVPVAEPGSPGKRQAKDGHFYRAIPFSHGTPTSGGAKGAPMGSAYKGQLGPEGAMKLGKAVYREAKKLGGTLSHPGGPTEWGGRLPAGTGGAQKLKPHHSTDIYAGMVRGQKTYETATQTSGYTTFRMISEANSNGWLRPDTTPGKQYAEKVQDHLQTLIPEAFEAYVKGLTGEGPA